MEKLIKSNIEDLTLILFSDFEGKLKQYLSTIRLVKVEYSEDFWTLYNQLHYFESDYKNNRESLLDWYKEDMLYTVQIPDTIEIFHGNWCHLCAAKFLTDSSQLNLPCFCAVKNGECRGIWVEDSLRNNGIAKFMLESLSVNKINRAVHGSESFWSYMKIHAGP